MGKNKCLDQITREGAKPVVLSLTEGCPSPAHLIMCHLFRVVSDLLLYASLKIAGPSILKGFIGRRGLSLLSYLGLHFVTEYIRTGKDQLKLRVVLSRFRVSLDPRLERQLPLPILTEPSSVSDVNNVVRSYTPSTEQEWEDLEQGRVVGPTTRT